MLKLSKEGSVGIEGKNIYQDVKAVQISLNKLLQFIPPTKVLKVDGSLGKDPSKSNTVAAIKLFQLKVVGLRDIDGRIDEGGRTHKTINKKLGENNKPSFSLTPINPLASTNMNILRQKMRQYEGKVDHMYLDTEGYVTVGVGHMIRNVREAEKLPFKHKQNGKTASKEDIASEYIRIKAMPYGKNYGAHKFKPYTSLTLPNSIIEMKLNEHIATFHSELRRLYGPAEFDKFPKHVKLALFDMIFNLGMTKLKDKFPNLNKHIKNHDWKNAALQCRRTKISAERNAYVKDLFNKAATSKA